MYLLFILLSLSLSGCRLGQQLSSIGEPPPISQIQDPNKTPGFVPVQMPLPPAYNQARAANSLWEPCSKAFFKDQRASRVGDIVTALIEIQQSESMSMNPEINRETKNGLTIGSMMGLENLTNRWFHNGTGDDKKTKNPNWIDFTSKPELKSKAKYNVSDSMQFKMACYVVQMLPNGNMVVQGRQEIRLVNEVREVILKGIIRREDISSNNTVHSDKIAEMRISYGGRGELSDMQSFPIGQQVLNKVMPF